jgi:hypothetical protein
LAQNKATDMTMFHQALPIMPLVGELGAAL